MKYSVDILTRYGFADWGMEPYHFFDTKEEAEKCHADLKAQGHYVEMHEETEQPVAVLSDGEELPF